MDIKAYICPQCGASLDVNQSTTFTFCPHCGNKLHISYEGETPPTSQRLFTTTNGLPVASATVPGDYNLEGVVHEQWQSELVPFLSYIRAASPDNGIILASASKELFYDVKSVALKTVLGLIKTHTKSGYVPFTEPDDYIKRWAEQMAGVLLTPVAKTKLPSPLGVRPELADAQLRNDIDMYGTYIGTQVDVADSVCEPILMKFKGVLDGKEIVAFVGADYEGAEISFRGLRGMGEVADFAGKAFSGLKGMFGDGFGAVKDAGSRMTMNDWLRGGLVGKMIREKKAQQQTRQTRQEPDAPADQTAPSPAAFGHGRENGSHVDAILYGSQRRYMCMALADKEEEATEVFLNFIGSITPDASLAQKESSMIQQKFNMLAQEAAANQAMAQQMQMQTRQMQMQTSQMIARNNQQVSAGIMDSWNRRQSAQSRMSDNFSQAVRGVNTYYTPTGGTVEMNVSADHVYQNQYGDTIGVSGNAVDPGVASKLNWTELKNE